MTTNTTAVTGERTAVRTKYSIVKSFRDGHVFVRENATGRIAVGDQSGFIFGDRRYFIERTDDGILWLDITRPVTLIKRRSRRSVHQLGYMISIPLLRPRGERTSTIGTDAEATFCHSLGMDVQGEGDPFVAEILAIKRG